MIRLIVGLGNPGQEYEKTRHNVGFLFLDELASEFGGCWRHESRFHGALAECVIAKEKVLLLKPGTYMNRSGLAVGAVMRYYKFLVSEVLVVHDELDFVAGVVKLKRDGGHAGHNGLRDIIVHLGSKDFYRLRIGIGRPVAGKIVADYVLSVPTRQESLLIGDAFGLSKKFIAQMVSGDSSSVMTVLNAV